MAEPESQVVQLVDRRPKPETERVLKAKWRTSLRAGWTVIPSVLVRALPRLHLDANGLAVLICLIDYWWAPEDLPWPSKKLLAETLGVSERTIQRTLRRLQEEKLITAEARYLSAGGQTSNRYDLSPLVARLEEITKDVLAADAVAKKNRRSATRPGARSRSVDKPTAGSAG